MWEKLQCDYFIELTIIILTDILDILRKEKVDDIELEVRKSNFNYTNNKLQSLLLEHWRNISNSENYLIFMNLLKESDGFVRDLNSNMDKLEREKKCSRIAEFIEKIGGVRLKFG